MLQRPLAYSKLHLSKNSEIRHGLRVASVPFLGGLRPVAAMLSVAALLSLAACSKADGGGQAAPAGAARPAPEVGVVTVQPGDVALLTELPGRLEASRTAQIRARVAGVLQERLFREGSDVKAGQILFRIDAAPLQAALQTAQATLARAEANLSQAKALADRYAPLVSEKAISQQEFAAAQASYKAAEADVAAGRAAVTTANINLNYASVSSPISGRIGRALVTEGALVGQGEATPLAVVQQVDPLYVNFTQSATEALRLRKAMEEGKLKGAGEGGAQVRLVMEDGSQYAIPGKLLFSDLTVDSTTGQVSLRAQVPNPKGMLLPGMYVRVQMEQAVAGNAFQLPQQAVTRSAQGDSVKVVGADGQIQSRNVTLGGQQGGRWVVLEGLSAGDQVMVDGFQKVQMLPPGTPVKAVPWTPASVPPAGAATSKDEAKPAAQKPAQ